MKKISIISCFILITVFSTAGYLIHRCYLNSYKNEFKSYIIQEQAQTFASVILINPSELYTNSSQVIWEDGNKEVLYKGILYDIIRIENRGLKVALVAVSDEQEMSLNRQFSKLFDLKTDGSSKNPFHLLKSFFTLKCVVIQPGNLMPIHFVDCSSQLSPPAFIVSSGFISSEAPPPDFLS